MKTVTFEIDDQLVWSETRAMADPECSHYCDCGGDVEVPLITREEFLKYANEKIYDAHEKELQQEVVRLGQLHFDAVKNNVYPTPTAYKAECKKRFEQAAYVRNKYSELRTGYWPSSVPRTSQFGEES